MVNFDALNLDLSYWTPLLAIVAAGEIMRGCLAQFNFTNPKVFHSGPLYSTSGNHRLETIPRWQNLL